jgi:hypothetical protein
MVKRPIFIGSTEGKSAEQIAQEAWEALQRYQAAQQEGEPEPEDP